MNNVRSPHTASKAIRFSILMLLCLFGQQGFGQLDTASIRAQFEQCYKTTLNFSKKRKYIKATLQADSCMAIAQQNKSTFPNFEWRASYLFATINRLSNNKTEAEEWYFKTMALQENTIGKETTAYAKSLTMLGITYMFWSKYSQADKVFLEAKSIIETNFGNTHQSYVTIVNNLGRLSLFTGDSEKAKIYFLECINWYKQANKTQNNAYAWANNNLGLAYKQFGQYKLAEQYLLEGLKIRRALLAPDHQHIIVSLKNLAYLYYEMNQYKKTEHSISEAVNIVRERDGASSFEYAQILGTYGQFLIDFGDSEHAYRLLLQAKKIRESSEYKLGKQYIMLLTDLGLVSYRLEKYKESEEFSRAALKLIDSQNQQESSLIPYNLHSLGFAYLEQGETDKAIQVLEKNKAIFDKKEWSSSSNLNIGLAIAYRKKGQIQKGLDLFAAKKQEVDSLYTPLRNSYFSFYYEYGRYCYNQNLYEEAHLYLKKAEASLRLRFVSFMDFIPTRHLLLINQKYSSISRLMYILSENYKKATVDSYDAALLEKNMVLNVSTELQTYLETEDGQRYKQIKRNLADHYATSKPDSLIQVLEREATILEKKLISENIQTTQNLSLIHWLDVQKNLKPHQTAIEFVHYASENQNTQKYAALLLRPNDKQPKFIPLFDESKLTALLEKHSLRNGAYANALYGKKDLYDLIWKPIEAELNDTKQIYYAPSGLLHQININAVLSLQNTAPRQLIRLNSTREIALPKTFSASNQNAMLFGAIQYEMDSTAIQNANKTYSVQQDRGALDFSYTDSLSRAGDEWYYLKSTQKELREIEPIVHSAGFQVQTRQGFEATEESFKALDAKSPRVLHFATHAYFFPNPKQTKQQYTIRETGYKASEHPMIRTGLIMAGANHAWKTGQALNDDMEDGILTAYEISQMDLSQTELVVLSACETGLGDIKGSEGVYGLQRAFKIAGAQHIIMSLWRVPDNHTRILMTRFYKNWLDEKMPISAALLAAQNSMKAEGYLPYFWAGFVVLE